MSLVAINIIADVGVVEGAQELARTLVHDLKAFAEGRIYDATFIKVADEGKRINLNEIIVQVEQVGESSEAPGI
jgi:hypothetical protein